MKSGHAIALLLVLSCTPVFADLEEVLEESRVLELSGLRAEARGDHPGAMDDTEDALRLLAEEAGTGRDRVGGTILAARACVLLHRLQDLYDATDSHKHAEAFLDNLEEFSLGGEFAALRDWYRAENLFRDKRMREADESYGRLGFIRDWMIIGPFENENGVAGFNREYPPESEWDPGASYEGKKRPVSWRRVSTPLHAGYMDLDTVLRPRDEVVAYAACFVAVPRTTGAAFRLASDEGVKVWLNGVPVHANPAHRDCTLDQDVVPVILQEGWNRVLLKVADSTGDWGFRFRVTDPAGEQFEDVSWAAELPAGETGLSHPGADTPPLPELVPSAREVLERRLKEHPASAHDHFHLGLLHGHGSYADREDHLDRESLARAVFHAPDNPDYQWHFAVSSASRLVMSAERSDNDYRRGLERTLELDPSHLPALHDLAEFYWSSQENLERALDFVRRAREINPAYPPTARLEVRLLDAKGFSPDAHLLRKSLAERFVKRSWGLVLRGLMLEHEGRLSEALRSFSRAEDFDFIDMTARKGKIRVLRRMGDLEKVLDQYRGMLLLNPWNLAAHARRAEVLASRDDFDGAVQECRTILEICPENEEALEILGRYLHRAGRTDEALVAWKSALELNPNLVELSRYVELLDTATVAWEDEFREDGAEVARLADTTFTYKDSAALGLLDQKVVRVQRDGTRSEYVHRVTRILNDRGIREMSSLRIPFARGEQRVKILRARVIHPDGSTEDARIRTWGGSAGAGEYRAWASEYVDLPPLSAADVVDVEYRVDDLQQGFFGDYFGDIHVFAAEYPVALSRYYLSVPSDREFHYRVANAELAPGIDEVAGAGRRLYRWEMKGLDRIEPEPSMPPLTEVAPTLRISTFSDWAELGRWYWSLIQRQSDVNDDIRSKVAELTADLEDDIEKAAAIYDFVVSEVRYNAWEFGIHGYKPYRASTIFDNKFGDCKDKSLLISVMLGEVGVEARPALLDATNLRGDPDMVLPMFEYFNHCISCLVDGDGEVIFLDGTATWCSPDTVPDMDMGARALVVGPDGGELVEVPTPAPSRNLRETAADFDLAPDGAASASFRVSVQGTRTSGLRYAFSVEEKRELMLERVYGGLFGGAKVTSSRFSDLSDLSVPVAYAYDLDIPAFCETRGDDLVVSPVFSRTGLTELASKSGRVFDLLLEVPRQDKSEYSFSIPAGYEVSTLPDPATLETPFGSCTIDCRLEDGTVRFLRTFSTDVRRVRAEDYPSFRDFAVAVDRLDQVEIVLTPSR